jgi:hypothetical protein
VNVIETADPLIRSWSERLDMSQRSLCRAFLGSCRYYEREMVGIGKPSGLAERYLLNGERRPILWMDGTQTGWNGTNSGGLEYNRDGTIAKGGTGQQIDLS